MNEAPAAGTGGHPKPPPPKHAWKEARRVIEHENEIINHRFTWLIAIQAGLLTFAGVIESNGLATPSVKTGISPMKQYIVVTCAGLLLSFWMRLQLKNAHAAIQEVCRWWETFECDNQHPPIQKSTSDLPWIEPIHLLPHNLPLAFIIVWAALLLLAVI